MITTRDITKLKTVFVTKQEFAHSIEELMEYIRLVNEATKKELRTEIATSKNNLREEIILFKDEILHEIIKIREDFAVLTGYRNMIEDHEQRITKIEKVAQLQ